jgi:hypothetical protein
MPDQSEHEKPENLVESPGEAEQAARTLEQAAASHQSLQGFEAINNERLPKNASPDEKELIPGDSSNIKS